jgi:hypothetical protein
MNKKEIVSKLGLLLVLSGIFIIIMQPFAPVTGAIIDISTTVSRVWFFSGIGMIAVGLMLLVVNTKKADRRRLGIEQAVMAVGNDDYSFILDTSGIYSFARKGKLKEFLESAKKRQGESVFIPEAVLEELKNSRLTNEEIEYIRKNSHRFSQDDLAEYKGIAATYLGLTKKAKDYFDLHQFYDEAIDALKQSPENKGRTLENIKDKYRGRVDDFDIRLNRLEEIHKTKDLSLLNGLIRIKVMLDKNYKPSKADQEVLAYAMLRARTGDERIRERVKTERGSFTPGLRRYIRKDMANSRKVGILALDTDFLEAIDLMEEGYSGTNPETKQKIDLKPHYKGHGLRMHGLVRYIEPKDMKAESNKDDQYWQDIIYQNRNINQAA